MPEKLIRRLSSLVILAFLAASAYAQGRVDAGQKNFLWRATSKTGTVYILGSVHFMKKDAYPLDPKIEDAFDRSSTLVVEADVNKAGAGDVQKIIDKALYAGEDTLEKHVSGETLELLRKEVEGLGMPFEVVNKEKPWFIAMSIEALELVKMGFDPAFGIDMHFLSKAGGKKILELESVDYQINLFSGFSDSEQELLLLYTIKEMGNIEQEIDGLVGAWKSGDAREMESILIKSISDDKRLSPIFEKLIYERNRKMTSKIERYLKTGDTYFVVVGAGHLVGKKGIIELLRAKRYGVEQM